MNEFYLVTVNAFDAPMYGTRVSVDYKLDTLPLLPVNLTDLATGLSALTGAPLATPATTTNNISPPTIIDNGDATPLAPLPATILVGYYKAESANTEPPPRSSVLPAQVLTSKVTSKAPFGINATFFLQFQPSQLAIAQGQKLEPAQPVPSTGAIPPTPPTPPGSPAAPPPQATPLCTPDHPYLGNTNSPTDTTLYLRDHLRALGKCETVISLDRLLPTLQFHTEAQLALTGQEITPEHIAALKEVETDELQESQALLASTQAVEDLTTFKNLIDYVVAHWPMTERLDNKDSDSTRVNFMEGPGLWDPSLAEFRLKTGITTTDKCDGENTATVACEAFAIHRQLQQAIDRLPCQSIACSQSLPERMLEASTQSDDTAELVEPAQKLAAAVDDTLPKADGKRVSTKPKPLADVVSRLAGPINQLAQPITRLQTSPSTLVLTPRQTEAKSGYASRQSTLALQLQNERDWAQNFAAHFNNKDVLTTTETLKRQVGDLEKATSQLDEQADESDATELAGLLKKVAHTAQEISESITTLNAKVSGYSISYLGLAAGKLASSASDDADTISLAIKLNTVDTAMASAQDQVGDVVIQAKELAKNTTDLTNEDKLRTNIQSLSIQLALETLLYQPEQLEAALEDQVKQAQAATTQAHSAEAIAARVDHQHPDPSPQGGAITGIAFQAGDFPLRMILHDDANSCDAPRIAESADPPGNPCVQYVSLTVSASGGASPSGQTGGNQGAGGKSQGGGGAPAGGVNSGGGSLVLSPTQAVDCSRQSSVNGPCGFTRLFTVDEPEWWDVSLGLSVPGVKETIYTFSPLSASGTTPKTTGNCLNNIYSCSLKHHADPYILFDIYPFASNWWSKRYLHHALVPNDAWLFPHLNFGIPIASQSLYRPYFGMAFNLTSPLQHRGFPLATSFYVGLVDMKQTICTAVCAQNFANFYPAPAGTLPGQQFAPGSPLPGATFPTVTHDRALKMAFGFEVSISAIASKIKSAGGSSKSASGGH